MNIIPPPRSLFSSVTVTGVNKKKETFLREMGLMNHTVETVEGVSDTLVFTNKEGSKVGEQAFAAFVNEHPELADSAVVVDDDEQK